MRSLLTALALFGALAISTTAHADTLFNFNGTLSDGLGGVGGTFSGTVTFGPSASNPTQFVVTGDDFTVNFGSDTYTFLNQFSQNTEVDNLFGGFFNGSGGSLFLLLLPQTAPLQNLPGGNICSTTNVCAGHQVSDFDEGGSGHSVISGTLAAVPPATTPEPSTLVLFGTGLLCVCGALRRKIFGRSVTSAARIFYQR